MPVNIVNYALSGFPAVAISTPDEDRAISTVCHSLVSQANKKQDRVWTISASGGLKNLDGTVADGTCTYAKAFTKAATTPQAVLVVLDLQHLIRQQAVYRALRDSLNACKSPAIGSIIVLVAPSWKLPPEIEHDIPVIEDSFPTRDELSAALQNCVRSVGVDLNEETERVLLDAGAGLTLAQAESAYALAWDGEQFDVSMVTEQKMAMVRQSGYFELTQPINPDQLGGLAGLKDYIYTEIVENVSDPELAVRGIMLVGPQGTGKSHCAKVLGGILQWPILKFDMGKLKGRGQGDSETAMAGAMKLAIASAPCVLFIDEGDKVFAGHKSSAETDGGVTSGMIGQYLAFQNDHRASIITVMTVNDFSKLPSELTRAGRFDEKFFVDLPNRADRVDVAAIHLRRFLKDNKAKNLVAQYAEQIADLTDEWTPAEIANLVLSAARRSKRQFTAEVFDQAAANIKPDSIVNAGTLAALRDWGSKHLRPANGQPAPVITNARSITRAAKVPVSSKAVAAKKRRSA